MPTRTIGRDIATGGSGFGFAVIYYLRLRPPIVENRDRWGYMSRRIAIVQR
jgi:hypothetical protein